LANRTAPLLWFLALSAGCLIESRPPEGSVAIYWTFWSQSMGNIGAFTDPATSVCTKAAVRDVRITLTTPAGDLLRPSNGPCLTANDVPGAAFDGLEVGTWGYYLEGRRGGVTVYVASGTFVVRDGERWIEDARASGGSWDVVASYTTTSTACSAGDRLRFDLIDTATLAVTFSTDDARVNPPVDVPCASGTFTIPSVAPGAYAFSDWVHVDAAGASIAYSTCRRVWTQADVGNTAFSGLDAIDVTSATAPPVGNLGVCP
jgi:hypothetical protein